MNSRLSSLELHGYKTFANQIPFKFPSMVTAIVGPNGSGKSNIADAIRWVLGEQSFSLLRAKKTEDMIFSGSDQRPRAGMASVSISFNNEDGWLPIDYAEVVLTRRAYRDGQNEYLINNQRVRLKDFHELLAKTGLADRTYTIIGQGLVDVALSIKPDERRRLFEEAAGIGLFRARKEETLKRLDSTRRNLDRVMDIMAEIRPRLRILERQAIKAAEYKQLQLDLQALLRDWYGYVWFKAQDEIKIAQKAYNQQELFLEDNRRRQDENLIELNKVRQQMQSNRDALNALHIQSAELHNELGLISRNLAILDERRRTNTSIGNQLEGDITALEAAIKSREIEKQNILIDHEQGSLDLNSADSKFQEIRDQVRTRLLERQDVEDQLNNTRYELVQVETSIIKLNAKKTELSERIIALNGNITQSQTTIAELVMKRKELETLLSGLTKKIEATENEITILEEDITRIQTEHAALKEKEKETNDKRVSLNNEKTRLSVQLDMLQQSKQALAGYSEGAKAVLDSVRQKSLKIHLSSLISQIIVPQAYEAAITAALGEVIDLLVLKDSGVSLKILDELESKTSDRIAIIASKSEKGLATAITPSKFLQGIPNAVDLIQSSEELKPTLEALLGNVFVVKDKQQALEIIKSVPEAVRIVTLKGELFLSNGIILLGKASSSNKVGVTRHKIDLEKKILEYTNMIASIDGDIEGFAHKLDEITQKVKNLVAHKNSLCDELTSKIREKANADLEFKKVDDQIIWLTQQVREFNHRIGQSKISISEVENSLAENNKNLSSLRAQEIDIKRSLTDLPVIDLQNELHRLETAAAVSRLAFKNTQESLHSIDVRLKEDDRALNDLMLRFAEIENVSKAIQDEEMILRLREGQVSSQIESMRLEMLLPLEQSLKQAESLYDQHLRLEEKLQKENALRERQFAQVQHELNRKIERLEILKERIEDDFGLVEFENKHDNSGQTPLPYQDMVIESLPIHQELSEGLGESIKNLKAQIRRVGSVNPEAQSEYTEVQDRFNFLQNQVNDLESASQDLHAVIKELDEIMQREFLTTYRAVSLEFTKMFNRLFNGGSARLKISDENDPIESGIDIEARLPGRREQGLVLLSGGERSMTAVALVFALLKVSPTPFCVLDEVDAMLDESNVGRFVDLLKELSTDTQFLLITHNRNTVQVADVIYGVTMGRDTTSQVISLKLDEVDDTYID